MCFFRVSPQAVIAVFLQLNGCKVFGAPVRDVRLFIRMILLAADTSGKRGSIALARAPDAANCSNAAASTMEILEVVPLAGGTFSAQLVPHISALLSKHALSVRDIGAFAAASGPGSFTGLRVGLAAIKALAEVLRKPIAPVSLLEVVARSANVRGTVLAALDAGRGEVYVGEYVVGDKVEMRSERLMSREELFSQAGVGVLATPHAHIAHAARDSGLTPRQVAEPGSDCIARIGWEKIQSGQTVSPEDLEANYIRRSDAEIFAKSNS
jgi:tRNA threonylcarbamoyladenosine biosynthesis protein TsaB